MKKLILGLLIGGFVMAGAAAKTAVVYFSVTGATERMAKNAAQAEPTSKIMLKAC